MSAFLSNVFNDPSDPWYYVIGVLFLLLIFGAVAVYIVFSNKQKKKNDSHLDSDVTDKPDEIKAEDEQGEQNTIQEDTTDAAENGLEKNDGNQ